MRDGPIDEATEIIAAWLNHDRTLNELASGIAYNGGRTGVKWLLALLLWSPEEVENAENLGIDWTRPQLVRSKLSRGAFDGADWDRIRELLIGE